MYLIIHCFESYARGMHSILNENRLGKTGVLKSFLSQFRNTHNCSVCPGMSDVLRPFVSNISTAYCQTLKSCWSCPRTKVNCLSGYLTVIKVDTLITTWPCRELLINYDTSYFVTINLNFMPMTPPSHFLRTYFMEIGFYYTFVCRIC